MKITPTSLTKTSHLSLKQYLTQYISDNSPSLQEKNSFLKKLTKSHSPQFPVEELNYFENTNAFYHRFKDEIWKLLTESAHSANISPLELINKFTERPPLTAQQFENDMAWFGFIETTKQLLKEYFI